MENDTKQLIEHLAQEVLESDFKTNSLTLIAFLSSLKRKYNEGVDLIRLDDIRLELEFCLDQAKLRQWR